MSTSSNVRDQCSRMYGRVMTVLAIRHLAAGVLHVARPGGVRREQIKGPLQSCSVVRAKRFEHRMHQLGEAEILRRPDRHYENSPGVQRHVQARRQLS
jgi:hypothetical protein